MKIQLQDVLSSKPVIKISTTIYPLEPDFIHAITVSRNYVFFYVSEATLSTSNNFTFFNFVGDF